MVQEDMPLLPHFSALQDMLHAFHRQNLVLANGLNQDIQLQPTGPPTNRHVPESPEINMQFGQLRTHLIINLVRPPSCSHPSAQLPQYTSLPLSIRRARVACQLPVLCYPYEPAVSRTRYRGSPTSSGTGLDTCGGRAPSLLVRLLRTSMLGVVISPRPLLGDTKVDSA